MTPSQDVLQGIVDTYLQLTFLTLMSETKPSFSVLVVEDDPDVSHLLLHHLTRAGYEVESVTTRESARMCLVDRSWDLIILDRRLPDGEGMAIASEIRERKDRCYVIVVTGESTPEAMLEGFEGGADDYVTKPFQMPELLARVRAGMRIVQLQKALVATNEKLEELSLTDGLTSLRNRRAFEHEFEDQFRHAIRYERPLSVAVVDVDHFKAINDEFGHQTGDAVLRAVARLLEEGTRQSDYVARVGGEEFAVVFPETPLFEGLQAAEKLRNAVDSAYVTVGEHTHHVTISIGLASIPYSQVPDTRSLMHAADLALYRAKQNGRNRVEMERRRERIFRKSDPDIARRMKGGEAVSS